MKPVTTISIVRIALGALAVTQPETAAKAFQLDGASNRQMPYMTRMFGSREIALGLMTLISRGKQRRAMTAVGIAVDSADAFAGFDVGRKGAVSPSASAMLAAPALLAVAGGILGLLERAPKADPAPATLALESE